MMSPCQSGHCHCTGKCLLLEGEAEISVGIIRWAFILEGAA